MAKEATAQNRQCSSTLSRSGVSVIESVRRAAGVSAIVFAVMVQAEQAPPDNSALDRLRDRLESVHRDLADRGPRTDLERLRSDALSVDEAVSTEITRIAPLLNQVESQLAALGPAGASEAIDLTEQRAQFNATRTRLDAQLKRARLLELDATQVAEQVLDVQRDQNNTQLFERIDSIFTKSFWSELKGDLPVDIGHVGTLAEQLGLYVRATPISIWMVVACLMASVLFVGHRARRLLPDFLVAHVAAGRLRRSSFALASTLIAIGVAGVAALALRIGMTWSVTPTPVLKSLLDDLVGMVCFGAHIGGLGTALLSVRKPSWRLAALPDDAADMLHWFPVLVAPLIVLGWLVERLGASVDAALPSVIAIDGLIALVVGIVLTAALIRTRRWRRQSEMDLFGVMTWLLETVVGLCLSAGLVALIIGYAALGRFAVKQIVWVLLVAFTVYLLNVFVEDLLMSWAGESGPGTAERADKASTAFDGHPLRRQVLVVSSALARVTIALIGLAIIVAPFGQGPQELLRRATHLRDGVTIGEFHVLPGTVLFGLAVLALGMLAVRLTQRWLAERFLPTTDLDEAMRDSAVTLLGYVGTVIVVALALSALGLGLERIAWIASALSVGIGFGLQAIVQNFVSGLILLAERPVRVGDWVALSGVEGDIRRINVRATEIQMSDRSTLIVPNSEFITKIVRNVTHASPNGLVQIKLPLPLDTDATAVKTILLAVLVGHEALLAAPLPSVQLDAVTSDAIVFNVTASVVSQRQVSGVRSLLLFEILERLREAGIALSEPVVIQRAPLKTDISAPTS